MSEAQFDPQEWLTTAEAAQLVGCSKHNLTRAHRDGIIVAVPRGNMLFFRRDDILAYIAEIKALGSRKHVPRIYRQPATDRIR